MIETVINNTKYKVIEPYKYHVFVGESITKIVEDGNTYFIHLDHKQRLLYKSPRTPVSLQTVGISSSRTFEDIFLDMINTDNVNVPTTTELNELRDLTIGNPVIIGGCGRSGTTLLTSILDVLPNLHVIKEETYAFYPDPMRISRIKNFLQDELENTAVKWCEKTPKNILNFRKIFSIFKGNVKLIHLIRDGRSVVTSKHPNGSGYWVPIQRWITDVKAGLLTKDIALQVKYEDLVSKPEATLKIISNYIDEPYEEKLLNYHEHTTLIKNIAWFNGARPINTSSIGNWKKPEYKERMKEFYNNQYAVDLLKELGYE